LGVEALINLREGPLCVLSHQGVKQIKARISNYKVYIMLAHYIYLRDPDAKK